MQIKGAPTVPHFSAQNTILAIRLANLASCYGSTSLFCRSGPNLFQHCTDFRQPIPALTNDPKPEPPEKPLPTDCCDSGCQVCVMDVYADDYAAYREALANWQARQQAQAQAAKT